MASESGHEKQQSFLAPNKMKNTILGFLVVATTLLATFCCRSQEASPADTIAIVIGAAMGSMSCVAGVLIPDTTVHAFALALATFITVFARSLAQKLDLEGAAKAASTISGALFAVTVTSSLPGGVFALLGSPLTLNYFVISMACALPISSLVMGSALLTYSSSWNELLPYPIGIGLLNSFLAILALIAMAVFYEQQSNRQGNLLIDVCQRGTAAATAIAFAWTIRNALETSETSAMMILPLLAGSVLMLLFILTMAAVTDRWGVGNSTQFQMASIDTATVMIYIAFSVTVLVYFVVVKHGDLIGENLTLLIKKYLSDELVSDPRYPPEEMVKFGFFFLMGLPSIIGVPLMVSLSPLGAYLYSNAYKQGQRGSKKLALIVHFNDLFANGASQKEIDETVELLSTELGKAPKTTKINVIVTDDDLKQNEEAIRKLALAGHYFVIHSDTVVGMKAAYREYARVLRKRAEWYHVGSEGIAATRPAMCKAASHFQLKIALWSNHIAVSSLEEFEKMEMPSIEADAANKGGGLFVYVTKGIVFPRGDSMVSTLLFVTKRLEGDADSDSVGFTFDTLPAVAN